MTRSTEPMCCVTQFTYSMLYAYFGGTTATGGAQYEVLLWQAGVQYTVVAEHQPPLRPTAPLHEGTTGAGVRGPRPSIVVPLYRGRDALIALRVLLHAAHAACNTPVLGTRYCYVLPRGEQSPPVLAPLVPGMLRYNNALPEHPQVWQVGRPLAPLPLARQADACPDRRMFGDERIAWAWQ